MASIFFISLFLLIILPALIFFKKFSLKVRKFYVCWFFIYGVFIIFGTGPKDINSYPPASTSPYKLPWRGGVTRFVAQGNNSFTSHHAEHECAWDFVMPNGTEILAARDGVVIEVNDQFDGIGLNSNAIMLQHADGNISAYAHIQKSSVTKHVGDKVTQGDVIALSGMVGQTIFPHVHFFVMGADKKTPVPISFAEVGVPLAGHFYTSANSY